ncbi:MAG TPA: hypothetical protein VD908_03545 [Cytophagales bacterium]|nr:hypothetical protein [Cytophagales bacterium]
MEEKILLHVGIDEGEINKAVKAIQTARIRIEELKKSQAELKKQGEGNSEQFILQEQELKKLSGVVNENSKILQINSNMNKANAEAIDGLRAANKALIKERDSLSTATDEGRKRIIEINQQIDKNTATINENSSATEKQRANIGNYASALDGLVPGLGGFASNLNEVREESGGVSQGIMGMVKSSLAFIATPIGAVLAVLGVALSAITSYLNGSEEGQNKFNRVLAIGGEIVEKVTDVIEVLGGAIFNGLGKAFSFIGDLAEKVFPGVTDSIKSFASDVINEADRISSILETSNKQERELIVERARISKESTQLRLEADELEGASRVKKLDQAIALERELLDKELEFSKTRLAIAEKTAADDPTIANKKALAEAQAELLNKEAEYNQEIRRNAKERITILDEEKRERDKKTKEREEEIKRTAETETEAARLLAEFRLQQQIEASASVEERVKREIALENFKRDELLKNASLTASQVQLINEQSEAAITGIKQKGIEDRNAIEAKDNAERKKELEDKLNEAIEKAEEELQIEINKEKEKFLNGVITREEYEAQLQEAQLASLLVQQEIGKKFGLEDEALAGKILDAKIAMKQKEVQVVEWTEKEKQKFIADSFGQVASLFNKNTIAYKLLASAEAAINTYLAASNALAAYPYPFGGIAAALAIVQGLVNVAKINSIKLPKMAMGGLIPITGKDHSQGGEIVSIGNKPVAEVQGGEDLVVLKRGASPMLKTLAMANKLAGGRDFYNHRQPQRYLADGGYVARTVSDRARAEFDTNRIANAIGSQLEKMPPSIVQVTEIERVQANRARAAKISELS